MQFYLLDFFSFFKENVKWLWFKGNLNYCHSGQKLICSYILVYSIEHECFLRKKINIINHKYVIVILFHHSRLKWILQYFKLHVYEIFDKGMNTTRAENACTDFILLLSLLTVFFCSISNGYENFTVSPWVTSPIWSLQFFCYVNKVRANIHVYQNQNNFVYDRKLTVFCGAFK